MKHNVKVLVDVKEESAEGSEWKYNGNDKTRLEDSLGGRCNLLANESLISHKRGEHFRRLRRFSSPSSKLVVRYLPPHELKNVSAERSIFASPLLCGKAFAAERRNS